MTYAVNCESSLMVDCYFDWTFFFSILFEMVAFLYHCKNIIGHCIKQRSCNKYRLSKNYNSSSYLPDMKYCAFIMILQLTVPNVYPRTVDSEKHVTPLRRTGDFLNIYNVGDYQSSQVSTDFRIHTHTPQVEYEDTKSMAPCKCKQSYGKFIKNKYSQVSESKIRKLLLRFGK